MKLSKTFQREMKIFRVTGKSGPPLLGLIELKINSSADFSMGLA